jgi:hypothetical protein
MASTSNALTNILLRYLDFHRLAPNEFESFTSFNAGHGDIALLLRRAVTVGSARNVSLLVNERIALSHPVVHPNSFRFLIRHFHIFAAFRLGVRKMDKSQMRSQSDSLSA